MTNKNTFGKVNKAFAGKLFAGLASVMMAVASIPFFTVSASANTAPVLNKRDTTVTNEDLEETRNVGVDLVLTDNSGFLAASFGIKYDDRLEYTDFVPYSEAGDAFEVVCNEEEHLLWFVGAAGTQADTESAWEEDEFLSVYFDIPEEVQGGNFELNFVWTGLDGSQAYWYADQETDLMDEMAETAMNGKVTYYNPGSEALSTNVLELNPYGQGKLEVLNASAEVFWFSSNPEIASVDETGLVSAVSAGTCQVQAYLNNHIMTCDVTVSDRYYYSVADAAELKLTDADANVVLEFPEDHDAENGEVKWISASPDVVAVDSDGTIHALQNGKANILATYNGTTYMRSIHVEFNASAASETIVPGDIDGNGKLEIQDIVYGNRIIVGVENATDQQIQTGDVNANGKLDFPDMMTLLRKLVGLE